MNISVDIFVYFSPNTNIQKHGKCKKIQANESIYNYLCFCTCFNKRQSNSIRHKQKSEHLIHAAARFFCCFPFHLNFNSTENCEWCIGCTERIEIKWFFFSYKYSLYSVWSMEHNKNDIYFKNKRKHFIFLVIHSFDIFFRVRIF